VTDEIELRNAIIAVRPNYCFEYNSLTGVYWTSVTFSSKLWSFLRDETFERTTCTLCVCVCVCVCVYIYIYIRMCMYIWGSGSGSTVSDYGLDDRAIGVRSPGGRGFFPLSSVSRPALGPTQPPVQWVPGVLSPRVKARPGHDADHSPPSSSEVENE
jgi:hypothetical protein